MVLQLLENTAVSDELDTALICHCVQQPLVMAGNDREFVVLRGRYGNRGGCYGCKGGHTTCKGV